MESKGYQDYCIAQLKEEDIKNITELEDTIRENTNREIVLIAYQHTDKA